MTTTRRDLTTLGENIESTGLVTPSVQERVRRLVASRARDRDDCQMLLEALGLADDPDQAPIPRDH
ncbi:hypothetical protein AB0D08_38870 [Kitasatospora sp. NPDC048540]|uniref:hypothetical protein n=1 Tax=unclassified Kitasatospora TaxID=2633591 RepID=UPI00053A38B7|nr:hypothetical protein [Kitasatospora sp. MBT63]